MFENEAFKIQVIDKLDKMEQAIKRMAEAQTLLFITQFSKLNSEQREIYFENFRSLQKNGWENLVKDEEEELEEEIKLDKAKEKALRELLYGEF